MQEGRIEIKTRPQKSGWLEEQVNSVFDIWQSKYFVLDGSELLVFDDDLRLQPTASINLHKCIVDGIWQSGEYRVFTIRSLNQDMEEQLITLGARSMQEVQEWKEIIKNAIILLEYETLFKALEAEGQFDKVVQESDYSISDMDSTDFQEHPHNINTLLDNHHTLANLYTSQNIPNDLSKMQNNIENKFQDHKNLWTLFQVESQFRIYKLIDQKENLISYKLQGHLESIDFDAICAIFSDPMNDQFWDFYIQEKELYLKVNEHYSIYKTKEQFYQNKQTYYFQNLYREISWIDTSKKNKVFYSFKQTIQDNNQTIQSDDDKKYKKLKWHQQIVRLEYVKKGYIQIQVYMSVPINQIQKSNIMESYLMERMINFSVFKFEYHEIIEKVQQRQRRLQGENNSNIIDQNKENNYQLIKSFQALESIDNLDINIEDVGINKSISNNRQIKLSSQFKSDRQYQQQSNGNGYNPSWNEDIHLRIKKLDQNQLLIFQKFKSTNLSLKLTDNQYIQFLIARQFNLQDAQEMMNNWIKWKQETNIDNLSLKNFSEIHKLKAYSYIGKDRSGRPVGLGISRYIFPSELPCDYDQYCLYYCVFLHHVKNQAEGYVDQIIMINDVGELNKNNVDLSLTRKQLKLFLDYFPEGVFKLIAVNADFFTRMIWKAIKPFLGQTTREKVVIVGSDQQEIHSTLLEYMDDDLIPEIYGGKNKKYSSY